MRHGLADERDARVHQKVVAPCVIERVVAVHEVDDDAEARDPCLSDGFNARRIAEAVVGRESPWTQKRFLGEGVRVLLGVALWGAGTSTLDEVDCHPGVAVVEYVAELVEERPDDVAVLLSAARQLDDGVAVGNPPRDSVKGEFGRCLNELQDNSASVKYLRDVAGRVRVGCCCPGPELGQAGLERIRLKCDELVGHR